VSEGALGLYEVQSTNYTRPMTHRSKNAGLEQVATRVSAAAHRVLKLVMAAEQKSMTDLLRPAVEEYARRLAGEPEIAAMLHEADKYAARKAGGLPPAAQKRSAKGRRPAH
jgi:hypothetical protein